jgi:carbamoyl-phosphate synthase small subunit
MAGQNLAAGVSPAEPFAWSEDLGGWDAGSPDGPPLDVVTLDCGAKRNIYRHLVSRGCRVRALPHDTSAEAILEGGPAGMLVSNGPGDPAAVERTIQTLRAVIGKIPIMGICLGHQMLALALGAGTYKLKFGHRGGNQPVRNLLTGNVEITSQNHGFCVDGESVDQLGCETTHVHLNDGTLAGFRHRELPLFSVQFHPEASPGPHDSGYLFDCFMTMMRTGGPITAEQMVEAQSAARKWQAETAPVSG